MIGLNNLDLRMLEDVNTTHLSTTTLKKRLESLLGHATRLKVILETVNHDTGEFRIIIQGELDGEVF